MNNGNHTDNRPEFMRKEGGANLFDAARQAWARSTEPCHVLTIDGGGQTVGQTEDVWTEGRIVGDLGEGGLVVVVESPPYMPRQSYLVCVVPRFKVRV
jgi:hypothetical protein